MSQQPQRGGDSLCGRGTTFHLLYIGSSTGQGLGAGGAALGEIPSQGGPGSGTRGGLCPGPVCCVGLVSFNRQVWF